jgi:hypothetical protein
MKHKSTVMKILLSAFIMFAGLLIVLFINFAILNSIIIGDEEAYDTSDIKTSWLFDIFYTISSDTGYHPEPSYFNFIFTALIGLILGGIISYKIIWRQKKEARTHNSGLA